MSVLYYTGHHCPCWDTGDECCRCERNDEGPCDALFGRECMGDV